MHRCLIEPFKVFIGYCGVLLVLLGYLNRNMFYNIFIRIDIIRNEC